MNLYKMPKFIHFLKFILHNQLNFNIVIIKIIILLLQYQKVIRQEQLQSLSYIYIPLIIPAINSLIKESYLLVL